MTNILAGIFSGFTTLTAPRRALTRYSTEGHAPEGHDPVDLSPYTALIRRIRPDLGAAVVCRLAPHRSDCPNVVMTVESDSADACEISLARIWICAQPEFRHILEM